MSSGQLAKSGVDWIFLDVGNVIFEDQGQAISIYRHYHQALAELRPEYTFLAMMAEREEFTRRGLRWVLHEIARQYLPDERIDELYESARAVLFADYDANHLFADGLEEVLDELGKNHRLGIIANQPPECRNSLKRRGLLDRFEVVAISEEIDLHKPAPEIFHWAIRAASVDPARTLMVGDRLDNDVIPAKTVGMKTVWLNHAPHSSDDPRYAGDYGQAFHASCTKVPLFRAAEASPAPDRTISSLRELPSTLIGL